MTALVLALGCFDLTTRSLWGDEGASIVIASQHGAAFWHAVARDGGNMLLYYLVLHAVVSAFGTGLVAVRLPSVIAAAACVPAIFLLARRLLEPRAAMMAAAVGSASLFLVYWGQMARGYTLVALLATVSTLAFVVACETGRPRSFVAYGVVTVLMCYTLLLAVLVVAAHLASLALRRGPLRVRALLVTFGAVALSCTPLVVLAVSRGTGQLFWLGPPTGYDVRVVTAFLASAPGNYGKAVAGELLVAASVVLVAGAAVLLVLDVARRGRGREQWAQLLLLGWLALPMAIAYLVSRAFQPVMVDRYFAFSVPATALVLGGLLGRIRAAPLAWSACAGLVALRLVQVPPQYVQPIDDYAGATAYVLSSSRPGDCVAFYSNDGRVEFRYYLEHRSAAERSADGPAPRPVLPAAPWSADPAVVEQYSSLSPSQLRAVESSCPRVWLVASHVGHPWGTAGSRANDARFEGLRGALAAAYPASATRDFASVSVTSFAAAAA
ncbi:MAG TPA: glycosyltransferase family 39 protein [Acidimicrobiales bacterium]|nr:glycosyltransferase family 39 protein [Acidimicrobiales bacterium]